MKNKDNFDDLKIIKKKKIANKLYEKINYTIDPNFIIDSNLFQSRIKSSKLL